MLKVIVVRVGDIPETKEFEDMEAVFAALGIKKNAKGIYSKTFETAIFNDGEPPLEKVGVIMHDQDTGRRKKNLLDIKGDFIIIGMERLHEGSKENPHMFESLTDDLVKELFKRLIRAALYSGLVR